MEFTTQKDLLEYLGKNPNDRSLIQRMIIRGEVYKEDGVYYLVEKENINSLRERIAELEKKLEERPETLTVSNGAVQAFDEARAKLMEQDLEEAKAQWKYYEELAEKRAVLMEKVIHETYVIAKSKLGGKMEGEAEFRESIIRRAKGINED